LDTQTAQENADIQEKNRILRESQEWLESETKRLENEA
jgi:hypothetical protein